MLISIRNSIITILLLGFIVQCDERSTPQISAPTPPAELFQTGDLVFRLGRTLQSTAIAGGSDATTGQRDGYSHIGIVIRSDSAAMVLHIEPEQHTEERLKIEHIEEFFSAERSLRGCVMRHGGLDSLGRNAISEQSEQLLKKGIRFDHDYSLSESERMYCTELAMHLFQSVGITLCDEPRELPLIEEPVVLPNDIFRNDSLRRVWHYSL